MAMKYEKQFNQFVAKMRQGIDVGQRKYGDAGLFGDSQLAMAKEEVRDLAVYAYLTWLKIDMLERKLVKKSQLKEFTGRVSKNAFDRRKDVRKR